MGLWLVLLVLAAAGAVRASEPTASDGQGRRGHAVWLFDVSSLTVGFHWYGGEESPRAEVGEPNAEGRRRCREGVLGSEGESTLHAHFAEDLVSLLQSVHATAFAAEGVRLSTYGVDRLLLVGPRALAEEVASALDELERSAARPVALDVLALRGSVSRATQADLPAAIACGDLVPLAGARVIGSGTLVSTFVGGYDAFVAAQDARVTWRSKAFDPVVGVARRGLFAQASLEGTRQGRIFADLHLWWAHPDVTVRHDVGATREPVETRETEMRTFDGAVGLVPGVWRLLPSTGDVSFAVLASVSSRASHRAPGEPLATTDPIVDAGPVALRTHSVLDLFARAGHQRGLEPRLVPSGYREPEPPGLPEARPAFPSDLLVDTIRAAVDPASWAVEGRSMDLKNGRLYVRTDEAHDRAVVAFLDRLCAATIRSTRLRATDVTLPLASIPEYFAGLGDGAAILRDGVRGLSGRLGARVVGNAAVTLRDGQRLTAIGGNQHAYVADFDPEITEASQLGDPIVRNAFEGVVFDASAFPSIDGSDVFVDLAWTRSIWRGSRKVPTSMGEIECPSLGISRIRGAVAIPRGAARVVGVALEGDEVTLTILEVSP